MQRIKELDGLRAIAILLVLGCHYKGFASLLGGLPGFGFIGVDIFFVLSGYLITTILLGLRTQPSPYWTFYSRRAVRIFPPYFACTILIMAIAIVLRDWSKVSLDYIIQQGYFLQAYDSSYLPFLIGLLLHPIQALHRFPALLANAHNLPRSVVGIPLSLSSVPATYWSLSIEEYFYLLWAPVVLRCPKKVILAIGIAVCIGEALLRWSYGINSTAYFGLIFRFDGLMYGALLALLVAHWKESSFPRAAFRVFTAIFLACAAAEGAVLFALHPVVGYEIRESPLFMVCGLPAISAGAAAVVGMMILKANSRFWPARLLRWAPMQFIGTISYTMYLVHVLALLAVHNAMAWMRVPLLGGRDLIEAILSAALTVAVARASWHWMEKPLLRWKDRKFPGANVAEPALN